MPYRRTIHDRESFDAFSEELLKDKIFLTALRNLLKSKDRKNINRYNELDLAGTVLMAIHKHVIEDRNILEKDDLMAYALSVARNSLNGELKRNDRVRDWEHGYAYIMQEIEANGFKLPCEKQLELVKTRCLDQALTGKKTTDSLFYERMVGHYIKGLTYQKLVRDDEKPDTIKHWMAHRKEKLRVEVEQLIMGWLMGRSRKDESLRKKNKGDNTPEGTPMPGIIRFYFKLLFSRFIRLYTFFNNQIHGILFNTDKVPLADPANDRISGMVVCMRDHRDLDLGESLSKHAGGHGAPPALPGRIAA